MKIIPLLASAMSGSMAGVTASHNRGGAYFRSRTIPTNPASSAQVALRGATAAATQRWSSVLTDAQRDGWDLYAQNTTWTDKLGQSIQLSGVNHYVRSNSVRIQMATFLDQTNAETTATIDDAPTTFALGETPIIDLPTLVNGAGPPVVDTFSIAINNAASYAAGDVLMVNLSGAVNPALRFFAGPYILSGNADATASPATVELVDTTGLTFFDNYTNRYPAPAAGQAVWGYARVTMADGRLSSKARFGPIIAT